MEMSSDGKDMLKGIEKFAPQGYYDIVCTLTIGYGFTNSVKSYLPGGEAIKYTDTMTEDQADSILDSIITDIYADLVKKKYKGLCLTQNAFDGLVILAYNCPACVKASYGTLIAAAKWADLAAAVRADKRSYSREHAAKLIEGTYNIQSTTPLPWRCQMYHTSSCNSACANCKKRNVQGKNGTYPLCGPSDSFT